MDDAEERAAKAKKGSPFLSTDQAAHFIGLSRRTLEKMRVHGGGPEINVLLTKLNIDLKRLQVWIGHENIRLTLDTYGHLLKDDAKDAELALMASRDLFSA